MLPLNTFINSIFPLLVYTVEFCKNYCVVYAQEKKSALSRKSCNIQSAYLSFWPILFLTALFMHFWHIWHIEAVSVKFFCPCADLMYGIFHYFHTISSFTLFHLLPLFLFASHYSHLIFFISFSSAAFVSLPLFSLGCLILSLLFLTL